MITIIETIVPCLGDNISNPLNDDHHNRFMSKT